MAANATFICLGYELHDRGIIFQFQVGTQLFLFNTASRSNLITTQLPAQWVPRTLFPERVKMVTCLHLVSRVRMRGAIRPLSHHLRCVVLN